MSSFERINRDLDMQDPEHLSRLERESQGNSYRPFNKETAEQAVAGVKKMKELIDSLPTDEESSQAARENEARQKVLEAINGPSGNAMSQESQLQQGLAKAEQSGDEDAIIGYKNAIRIKSEQQTTSAQQEKMESSEPTREVLATGEKSTLLRVIQPDGKESSRLESEFFDIVDQFRQEHKNEYRDFFRDIGIPIASLSTDLALVDATNGKNLADRTPQEKREYLEDYSLLRSKLEDNNTPAAERQFIDDYFKTMDSKALAYMTQEYDSLRQQENDPAQDEKKAEIESTIEDALEELEATRSLFADSSQEFDNAFATMETLIDGKSMDADELDLRFSELRRAYEDFQRWIFLYEADIDNYENTLFDGRDIIGREGHAEKMTKVYDSEKEVSEAKRRVAKADDQIADFKKHISKVKDTLYLIKQLSNI